MKSFCKLPRRAACPLHRAPADAPHRWREATAPPHGGRGSGAISTEFRPPAAAGGAMARAPAGPPLAVPAGPRCALAQAQGGPAVLDPDAPAALVLVALGRRLPVGPGERQMGLGLGNGGDGLRQLSDRAGGSAAAVRPRPRVRR